MLLDEIRARKECERSGSELECTEDASFAVPDFFGLLSHSSPHDATSPAQSAAGSSHRIKFEITWGADSLPGFRPLSMAS